MTEKKEFKVAYPAIKDSLIFGDSYKVLVAIGKLMMRGFQNTLTFNPSIIVRAEIAY